MEALALRGIRIRKIPLLKRIRMFVSLIFPVFAKALYNVKYRAISLELRGFRLYRERTYLYYAKLKLSDIMIQIAAILSFIFIIKLVH
jgi:energy-coupling factor transport system permease protein